MATAHKNVIQSAARTECGSRSRNEDTVFARDLGIAGWRGLYAVADGLGGQGGGQRASRLVAKALEEATDRIVAGAADSPSDVLDDVVSQVVQRIEHERSTSPHLLYMGTTLTALALHDGVAHLRHVGDSRLYGAKGLTENLELMTEDHNIGYRLFREGTLNAEEYRDSPMRNRLYRYLGRAGVRIDRFEWPLSSGDRYLLVTDGCLEDGAAPTWPDVATPADFVRALFKRGEATRSDNASAVAIEIC